MNKKIIFLIFVGLLYSCSDDNGDGQGACGVANPVETLVWLKAEIDRREANPSEDMKYCYIVQARLGTMTVFRYEDCNPLINKAAFTLDCEGERIDSNDNPISEDQLMDKRIIWKTEDFACVFNF